MLNEENWYAINIFPSHHDRILKEIQKVAWQNSIEINIFNPHYIPKRRKRMVMKNRLESRTAQIYDGYLYIYINKQKLQEIDSSLKSIKGILKVMQPSVTQKEFDAMYDCVMGMYKNFKSPISKKSPSNINGYVFKGGETVKIVDGQLEGFSGKVKEIHKNGEIIKIALNFLGKETMVSFPPSMVVVK